MAVQDELKGCPRDSEQLYDELKGLPRGLMTVGEHEYHELESPIVQLEWQYQIVPCVAFFFSVVHSQAKWPERPRLKQVWVEAVPAVGGAGRRITGGVGGRALGAARGCWCSYQGG
jgi:hypothetical protein